MKKKCISMDKIKNELENQKGATLVEMIVTFALLAIFLTSATLVMGSYFNIYTHVRDYGYQQTLANTLLDTIEEELSNAEEIKDGSVITIIKDDGEKEEYEKSITILKDGTEVNAGDLGNEIIYQNQYPITMKLKFKSNDTDSGELLMIYHQIKVDNQNKVTGNDTEWSYGEGVYNENKITGLTFQDVTSEIVPSGSSIASYIKVTLTLKSDKTKTESEFHRIVETVS